MCSLYLGDQIISGQATLVGESRNIGQIIPSAIPLTDAGLHLLDGSRLSGDGIYKGFVDYIAELYAETTISGYKSNVNIVGSLSNNNGILSGFSTSNYAEIPQQLPLANANSFEFVTKFTYDTSSAMRSILAERNASYFSQVSINNSGKLYVQLSNNHTSVNMGSATGTTTIVSGNNYYLKFTFDGSSYKVYLSFTGEFDGEETEEINITSSAKLLNFNWNIGCSALSGYEQPFNTGTIDLKETYININGSRWWTGAEEIKPCFCTEAQWQSSVTTYGVCGKFVYDSTNNTVRLPKVTGKLDGTTDVSVLGDLAPLGIKLPNITGSLNSAHGVFDNNATGAFRVSDWWNDWNGTGGATLPAKSTFDASRCSSVYSGNGTDTTIHEQAINVLLYIVIATSTKTDIEVDIDEIATDLNNKADVDLTNCTKPHIVETYVNGTSWYRVYSDGWCEQGGRGTITTSGSGTITFLKPFANTNYSLNLTKTSSDSSSWTVMTYIPSNTNSTAVIKASLTGYTLTVPWQACGYIR